MNTTIIPYEQKVSMAESIVKSGLFGIKTKEQALALFAICEAEGKHPATAIQEFHIIQGKPALRADAMLARFQAAGGVVEWTEYTDLKVVGLFSHPKSCPKPVSISWTLDMAKRIGLATKDNWVRYPRAMLRSRVISEGVRTCHPGVAVGLYTIEEVQDFTKERDITPTAGAGDSLSEEQRVKISDLADRVREWMLQGSLTDAFAEIDNAGLDPEEYIFLWTHFDSKTRRQLKEEGERQRTRARIENKDATINEAQRKRLEARISEMKLDREMVKKYVKEIFGKDHFTELTNDDYSALDGHLESMVSGAPKAATTQNIAPTERSTGAEDATPVAAPYITAAEALVLDARCSDNGINVASLMKAAGVASLSLILSADLPRAHTWVDAAIARRKTAV